MTETNGTSSDSNETLPAIDPLTAGLNAVDDAATNPLRYADVGPQFQCNSSLTMVILKQARLVST